MRRRVQRVLHERFDRFLRLLDRWLLRFNSFQLLHLSRSLSDGHLLTEYEQVRVPILSQPVCAYHDFRLGPFSEQQQLIRTLYELFLDWPLGTNILYSLYHTGLLDCEKQCFMLEHCVLQDSIQP